MPWYTAAPPRGSRPRYTRSVMKAPRYICMTKGTDRAEGPPTRGTHWIVSRRGRLAIYDDRVELGDWTIPHHAVRAAKAYEFGSLFGTARVLELRTDERTYQFGLNPWANPLAHLPYPVAVERAPLAHTPLSIVLRLGVAAVLSVSALQAARDGRLAWTALSAVLVVVLLGQVIVPLVAARRAP